MNLLDEAKKRMKSGRTRSLPGSLFTVDYKNSLKTEWGRSVE